MIIDDFNYGLYILEMLYGVLFEISFTPEVDRIGRQKVLYEAYKFKNKHYGLYDELKDIDAGLETMKYDIVDSMANVSMQGLEYNDSGIFQMLLLIDRYLSLIDSYGFKLGSKAKALILLHPELQIWHNEKWLKSY